MSSDYVYGRTDFSSPRFRNENVLLIIIRASSQWKLRTFLNPIARWSKAVKIVVKREVELISCTRGPTWRLKFCIVCLFVGRRGATSHTETGRAVSFLPTLFLTQATEFSGNTWEIWGIAYP